MSVPGPVDVLQSGFATQEMFDVLVTVVGGYAQVTWMAPADAQTVACALFSCQPEVSQRTGSLRIVNFDQCVLAFATKPAGGSYIDLGDSQYDYSPASSGEPVCGGSVTDGAERPVISALSVGCWAYSSTALVAASDLTGIPAYEASAALKESAPTCRAQDDGLNCVTAGGAFGTCSDARCRARCLTDSDCTPDETRVSDDASEGDAGDSALQSPMRCSAQFRRFAFGLCVEGDGG